MRNSQKPSRFLLAFVKLTGILPALLFFKPKIYYMGEGASKKLPKPCIFMSNHKSLMDFVLYLMIFPWRTIRFLMAEVLFKKGKLFSWFLYRLGGIYVNRDAFSFDFVGQSLQVLEQGGTVGIFPEGRLPVKGKAWPFKPSVAYISLRTDAPIVPVYTDGNYGLFKRAHVMIGEPVVLPRMEEKELHQEVYDRVTAQLQKTVEEMGEELKRRVEKL